MTTAICVFECNIIYGNIAVDPDPWLVCHLKLNECEYFPSEYFANITSFYRLQMVLLIFLLEWMRRIDMYSLALCKPIFNLLFRISFACLVRMCLCECAGCECLWFKHFATNKWWCIAYSRRWIWFELRERHMYIAEAQYILVSRTNDCNTYLIWWLME